jgi:Mg2+/Co2+ transporter CorB
MADCWYRSNDEESFRTARRLIQYEGLLVGGSSGAAMAAAIYAAKRFDVKGKVIVILPDSIRNYMTKFVSDDWLYCNQFLEDPYQIELQQKLAGQSALCLKDMKLGKPLTLQRSATMRQALYQFKLSREKCAIILKKDATLEGLVYFSRIVEALRSATASAAAAITSKDDFLQESIESMIEPMAAAVIKQNVLCETTPLNLEYLEKLVSEKDAGVMILDEEGRIKGKLTWHDLIYLNL